MDTHELLRAVAFISKTLTLNKIRVTGGEPLLRPDVVELVQELRHRMPELELCMTTNGAFLQRMAPALKRAGLDRINISVDTADELDFKLISGGGSLGQVIRGIEAAREAGFTDLKLNAVLLKNLNGARLGDLVRLAAGFGAEMRFIELMPFNRALGGPESEFLSSGDALLALLKEFQYGGTLDSHATARRHVLLDGGKKISVGFISPVSQPFCFGCSRLRMDSRGRLFSCLRETGCIDVAGMLAAGSAGWTAAQGEVLKWVALKQAPRGSWPCRDMSEIGG